MSFQQCKSSCMLRKPIYSLTDYDILNSDTHLKTVPAFQCFLLCIQLIWDSKSSELTMREYTHARWNSVAFFRLGKSPCGFVLDWL